LSHEQKIEPSDAAKQAREDESANDVLLQLSLRLKLDEVADLEAVMLRDKARREPTAKELRRLAGRIYEARRMREKVLSTHLFGEPAWDMLLALYHMPAQGKLLSVSGLCFVSGVPQTTALRWQTTLTRESLIERGPDQVDARRQFMRLTDKGRALMSEYLSRLFYVDVPIPPPADQDN